MQRVERARRRSTASSGARATGRGLRRAPARAAPQRAASRGAALACANECLPQLVDVGHDESRRRGRGRCADVGGQVAERRVLLVPDGRHDRNRARGDGANDAFVARTGAGLRSCRRLARARSRQRRVRHRSPIAVAIAAAARGPCTYVSATRTFAGGKRCTMCVSTSCFAAASLPVTSPISRGNRGSGRLRSAAKSPSAASLRFSRSSAARYGAEPEALDRERPEAQLAPLLVELRPGRRRARARRRAGRGRARRIARAASGPRARAVLRVLQREEHGRPALLAPELRDLALDPQRREAVQPRRDARIEGPDAVDLASVDLRCLDFHCRRSYARVLRCGPSRRPFSYGAAAGAAFAADGGKEQIHFTQPTRRPRDARSPRGPTWLGYVDRRAQEARPFCGPDLRQLPPQAVRPGAHRRGGV